MSNLTFSFSLRVPEQILIPGQGSLPREDFYTWLWEKFAPAGLIGVHEGTLLSEEAAEVGLETDSWTVDAGEAPRERDWVGHLAEAQADLFFSVSKGALGVQEELKKIPELIVGELVEHPPQDWDAQWKASFLNAGEGVQIPPFWKIVPPWVDVISDFKTLKINPGAGFGTGTHETTQLCLEAIGHLSQKFPFLGEKALDFGSGSGILSIGLALLGASVDAVEIDPLANDNARENARLNRVQDQVHISSAFRSDDQAPLYRIVVANILKPVLLEFANDLVGRLRTDGAFILSGLIEKDVAQVSEVYSRLLGQVPSVFEKGEWRVLVFLLS